MARLIWAPALFACVVGWPTAHASAGDPFPLGAGEAFNQQDPATAGPRVAWFDDEGATRASPGSEIRLAEPGTGMQDRLEGRSAKSQLSFDGHWLVWSERRGGDADILARAVDGTAVVPVHEGDANQIEPDVDHPWVAYQDDSGPNNTTRGWVSNLEDGRRMALSGRGAVQLSPRLDGDLVAWVEVESWGLGGYAYAANVSHVYARNLTTGEERRITDGDFPHTAPDVDGSLIVWQELRSAGSRWSIASYDWAQKTTHAVVDLPGSQYAPRIRQPFLAWREEDHGIQRLALRFMPTGARREFEAQGSLMRVDLGSEYLVWGTVRDGAATGAWDAWAVSLVPDSAGPTDGARDPGGTTPAFQAPMATLGALLVIVFRRHGEHPR